MKWIQIIIAINLIVLPGVWAGNAKKSVHSSDPLAVTLREYQGKGYQLTGPVQYLGKTRTQVKFYRHAPMTFTRLSTITPIGKSIALEKYDFVYLLQSGKQIVLVRIKKKERENV